jgi:hypothetical protein
VADAAADIEDLIAGSNGTKLEHAPLDLLNQGVAVGPVELSKCRLDVGNLAGILKSSMQTFHATPPMPGWVECDSIQLFQRSGTYRPSEDERGCEW